MSRLSVLSLVLSLCAAVPTQAQLFRAYLSVSGNDSNPCTLPAPCRLLPAALNAVASGGEIWMLDSGNFNTGGVEVAKSVSLVGAPGAAASLVGTASSYALNITAATHVTLRNLTIVNLPANPGEFGIRYHGSGSLDVLDCHISGFQGAAITLSTSGHLDVVIRRTVLHTNSTGILANTYIVDHGEGLQSIGRIDVTVEDSQLRGNWDFGVFAGRRTRVTIANSVMSGNGSGIAANGSAESPGVVRPTVVEVERSVITNNTVGLMASASTSGAILNLVVRGSTVSRNGKAVTMSEGPGATLTTIVDNNSIVNNDVAFEFLTAGPEVFTRGNNLIRMNATEIQGGGAYTPLAGT